MLMRRRVFALIPARGGSKGVHKKNLRLVKGHSLVERAILSAIGAVAVDMTYLSSDDDDILNVGRSMGIAVYKRESRAADDAATADDVVLDFITRLPKVELENDPYIVYLQPTSPFRTSVHIDNAFREMGEKKCTTCISVISLTKSPYKSFILTSDGLLKPMFGERFSSSNRQALPPAYYPNGAIYIFPISEFTRRGTFPSEGSLPFVMDENVSIDIDTEEDIAIAEKMPW